MSSNKLLLIGAPLLLAACTTTPPKGWDDLKPMAETVGHDVIWRKDEAKRAKARAMVQTYLDAPLTPKVMAAVALLNSPYIQIELEHIGLSAADVIDAGTLDNPSFGFKAINGKGAGAEYDFDVVFDLLGLILLPSEKDRHILLLESARQKAASHLLDYAIKVENAGYELIALHKAVTITTRHLNAAKASYVFAKGLYEAGNIPEKRVLQEEEALELAKIDLLSAKTNLAIHKHSLGQLMGLRSVEGDWAVSVDLPVKESVKYDQSEMVQRALDGRADLIALRRNEDAALKQLKMIKRSAWISSAEAGAAIERDSEGNIAGGPSLEIQLPIFHQGQADIMAAESRARQATLEREEKEITISHQVESALLALESAATHWEMVRGSLVPLRHRLSQMTLREYNFMLKGAFELLETRRRLLDAQMDEVKAASAYWQAHTRLKGALGGAQTVVSQSITSKEAL